MVAQVLISLHASGVLLEQDCILLGILRAVTFVEGARLAAVDVGLGIARLVHESQSRRVLHLRFLKQLIDA